MQGRASFRVDTFTVSPAGEVGRGDVAGLMRPCADVLAGLGSVRVRDTVFHSVLEVEGGDQIEVTVYYVPEPDWR